jgi:disulfide bond formation protein DsbB
MWLLGIELRTYLWGTLLLTSMPSLQLSHCLLNIYVETQGQCSSQPWSWKLLFLSMAQANAETPFCFVLFCFVLFCSWFSRQGFSV